MSEPSSAKLLGILCYFGYQAYAHPLWVSYSLGLNLKPEHSSRASRVDVVLVVLGETRANGGRGCDKPGPLDSGREGR